MLFSEPKIPQFSTCAANVPLASMFQCSSASRKFLNLTVLRRSQQTWQFQCSSASRKFLNRVARLRQGQALRVSVLFSEPKIPQSSGMLLPSPSAARFSALQRAENSSMLRQCPPGALQRQVSVLFSEPKIPQSGSTRQSYTAATCFSALQRAENSSMLPNLRWVWRTSGFSALQRAENSSISVRRHRRINRRRSFSALQRAENSSIALGLANVGGSASFSALQRAENSSIASSRPPPPRRLLVSVLFSEPKIPQCCDAYPSRRTRRSRFSALQRAENSSMSRGTYKRKIDRKRFQCSSASRKFLNSLQRCRLSRKRCGFSALQRAENSSIQAASPSNANAKSFSALQRAENSSISASTAAGAAWRGKFQCSSASRKFLNC